jgi:hypothetical protein
MAAAAIHALTRRQSGDGTAAARLSLARTAKLLADGGQEPRGAPISPADADWSPDPEATGWGPARRLRPPSSIDGVPMRWDHPASQLGSAKAAWK